MKFLNFTQFFPIHVKMKGKLSSKFYTDIMILRWSLFYYCCLRKGHRNLGAKGSSINDVTLIFQFVHPLVTPVMPWKSPQIAFFCTPSLPLWGDVIYGWPLNRRMLGQTDMNFEIVMEIALTPLAEKSNQMLKFTKNSPKLLSRFQS